MKYDVEKLIEEIEKLPSNWHDAGSVSGGVLRAIALYANEIGTIEHSMESGSGRTTLLFSHLSLDHVVFSLDDRHSITVVKQSSLLNSKSVTFVEGPTQLTLPNYIFRKKIQIALIDGPHGYPFPDLEYFYFYPHIATGGLLIIDDIQIPTIRRMFDIVKADAMFALLEIVEDKTAFFRRTDAPLFDPLGDNWCFQGYNRFHYDQISKPTSLQRMLRKLSRFVPSPIKKLIPIGLKKKFW